MPTRSHYISSIILSFSTFVETKVVDENVKQEAVLVLLKVLEYKKDFSQWDVRLLDEALEKTKISSEYTPAAVSLVREFVFKYPPYQTTVFIHQYLLALRNDGCSHSTIKNYRSDIDQYAYFIKETHLDNFLSKPKVLSFLKYEQNKGLRYASIYRKLVSLTQFALWAEAQGLIHGVVKELQRLKLNLEKELSKDIGHGIKDTNTEKKPVLSIQTPPSMPYGLSVKPPSDYAAKGARANQEYRSQLHERLNSLSAKFSLSTPQRLTQYFNLALLLLLVLGVGYFGYAQLIKDTPQPFAYPATPNRPARSLSFQGRLTDTAQNPITTATDMRFKLFDDPTAGTELWDSGTCSITPDQDGIFSTGLGDGGVPSDCGPEISEDVFSENASVYLEVTIEAETLDPRQPIKSVAYALNSETLQGYPIDATGSATKSTVVTMNEYGEVIFGEISPKLKSVSGTFTIEAQALTLQTASGSNGNINLNPDGTGRVNINSDLNIDGYLYAPGATLSATYTGGKPLVVTGLAGHTANLTEWSDGDGNTTVVDENGNIGVGTSNPGYALHTKAATVRFESSSGTTEYFQVSSNGRIVTQAGSNTHNNNLYQIISGSSQSLSFQLGLTNTFGTSPRFLSTSGMVFKVGNGTEASATNAIEILSNGNVGINSTTPSQKLDISGNMKLSGAFYDGSNGAGTSGYVLSSTGTSTVWADPAILAGGTNLWDTALGALYPKNSTMDLLIGGTATTSAKFAFLNVNSGTPTASISAGVNGATTLSATGILGTTAGQNLTFSPSGTARMTIGNNGNVGIGSTSPTSRLDVGGGNISLNGGYLSGDGGNEGVHVTSTGMVGIGITNPFDRFANTASNITDQGGSGVTGGGGSIAWSSAGTTAYVTALQNSSTTGAVKGLLVKIGSIDAGSRIATFNSNGTDRMVIQGDGNVGIGVTSPTYKLQVNTTDFGTSLYAGSVTSTGTTNAYGMSGAATANSSSGVGFTVGVSGAAISQAAGGTSNLQAGRFSAQTSGSSPAWVSPIGVYSLAQANVSSGTIIGFNSELVNASGASSTGAYGLRVQDISNSGTLTNTYGVHVGDITTGTQTNTPFSFYASDASAFNYFAGNTGIGTTSPSGTLHVAGSSTTNSVFGSAATGFTVDTSNGQFKFGNGGYIDGYYSEINLTGTVDNVSGTKRILTGSGKHLSLMPGGNVGIDSTSPGYKLDVNGTLRANSTVNLTGLGTGTDNTVLILDGSNNVTTDEIDPKVWGTGIVDTGGGTTNYLTKWTAGGETIGDSVIYDNGTNVGIGTTTVGTYRLNVDGSVNLTSGNDFSINGIGLNDNASISSGASLIGLYDDSMTYIAANTTVQGAIKELDTAIGTVSTGASKWDITAGAIYPKNSTTDLLIGGTATTSAKFAFLNVNSGTPTASISAGVNGATTLTATGILGTTAGQNLTFSPSGTARMTIANNGNIGIGTSAPIAKLDINGTADAIQLLVRANATQSNTNPMMQFTDSFGSELFRVHSDSNSSVFIGYEAGLVNAASNNTFIGSQTGTANTSGNHNTFVGTVAGTTNDIGFANDAFGSHSLNANTDGDFNAGFGAFTLGRNTTGSSNLAVGYSALYQILTGSNNTAVGIQAGQGSFGLSDFSGNTLLGYRSGYLLRTGGDNNILIGLQAGDNLTTGSKNIVIGHDIDAPSAASTETLNIGNLIYGVAVDGTGTTISSGNVGIGTTSPDFKLQVNGTIAPETTDQDLGDSSLRWDLYANTINADSTVTLTGLGTGTDNTVLILDGSNNVTTDEIDPKVWGTGIVDTGGGTTNYLTKWTNGGETIGDSVIYDNGTNVGVGTTTVGTYRLNVDGSVNLTSGNDYSINGIGLNDNASISSGASLIGLYDDSMTYIAANTTVQGAIKELDTAIGGVSSGASKWDITNGAIYPKNSTTDLLIGGTATTSAKFAFINVNSGTPTASISAGTAGASTLTATGILGTTAMQNLTLGNATTGNLVFAPAGSTAMTILQNGNVGIGSTAPGYKLDITGDLRVTSTANFNGGVELGDASGDLISFNGRVDTDIIPNTDGGLSLGSSAFRWEELFVKGATIDIGDNGDSGLFGYNVAGDYFTFDPDNDTTAEVIINDAGNVGVGTTTASELLTLAGGNVLHYASGNPTLEGSLDTSGTAADVYVSGNYAYVADNVSGMHIMNVTDPANPVLEGTYNPTGFVKGVHVAGKYAYLAAYEDGLVVVDISNPNSPSLVGSYDSNFAEKVYVSGKYAYVADAGGFLYVVNVSNPASPSMVGSYNIGGSGTDVYVSGKYAFVTDDTNGLRILDVTNPASPSLTGSYTVSELFGVYVSGMYAYVADDSDGLRILDISNPASPSLVGTYNTAGSASKVVVAGNYAYVGDTSGGVQVVNVANRASPSLVGTYDTSGSATKLFLSGKYLYVSDGSAGLAVIDINGSTTPSISTGNLQASSLFITENGDFGNNLYVRNGLNVGAGGILTDGALSVSGVGYFGGNVGIGSVSPGMKLDVNGDIRAASGSDFYVGSIGLNDNASVSSGASLVGLYDDSMTYITANTTVQGAIKELDTAIGAVSTGASRWDITLGALHPKNTTTDLLIGGTATTSAKFAFLNVNSGTPTASISAGTNGAATLTATGVLGTTAMQNLTLGNSTTGNLTFAPAGSTAMTILQNGNVGIGSTAPGAKLDFGALTSSNQMGIRTVNNLDATGATTADAYSIYNSFNPVGLAGVDLANVYGIYNSGTAGKSEYIYGVYNNLIASGSPGPGASNIYGTYNNFTTNHSSTTGYGSYFETNSSTSAGTQYAYYANMTAGTATKYGLYLNGGINYLSGNLGIGDTTPDQLLEVLSSGAANTQLSLGNTNAGDYDAQIGFELADGTNTFTVGVDDSDGDKFKISTTGLGTNDRFIIDSTGNIGINDSTPTYKLDVNGDGRFTGAVDLDGDLELNSTLTDVNGSVGTSGQILSSTATGVDWVDASTVGTNYWQRVAGNLSPLTLNDTISATTSAATAMTITQTGAFNALLVQDEASDASPFIIDQAGNVGIGSTSVNYKFLVTDSSTLTQSRFENSNASGRTILEAGITGGAGGAQFDFRTHGSTYSETLFDNSMADASALISQNSSVFVIGNFANSDLVLGTNNAERLRILADGNIGIGDATPTYKLDVNGTGRFTGAVDLDGDLELNSTLTDVNGSVGSSGQILSSTATGVDWVDASTVGTNYWQRVAGNLSPLTLNDTISATTSAATAMTITQTGAFNALLIEDQASDASPFIIDQAGNVGVGTTATAGKLDVNGIFRSTYVGSSTAIEVFGTDRLIGSSGGGHVGLAGATISVGTNLNYPSTNSIFTTTGGDTSSGSYAFYARNSALTDLMVIQNNGNVGIGTTTPVEKLEVAGDLLLTNFRTRSVTRTLPTTVNDYVNIGSFAFTNGGGAIRMSITVPSSSFSTTKEYLVPIAYDETANTWHTVQPISSTGDFTGNDFDLDVNVNAATASFRIRRSGGSTAGTAYVSIKQEGLVADAFTASSSTGSTSAPGSFYTAATLTQVASNVGIGDSTPTYKLDVNGTGRFTGAVDLDGDLELNNTLTDINGAVGSAGQILSSTGSGVDWIDAPSGGAVAWNDLTAPTGNLSLAMDADTTSFSYNTLTSGTGWSLNSTATAFTGTLSDITLSGSNAANTGTLLAINNTGTSNANTSMLINHYATGTNNLAFRVNDVSGDTSPFVIDGTGNVGIGTTAPTYPIEVVGSNVSMIVHHPGSARGGIIAHGGGVSLLTTADGDDLFFGYNTSTTDFSSGNRVARMMIDNGTGNVGIGTTSPLNLAHLRTSGAASLQYGLTLQNPNGTDGSAATGISFISDTGTAAKGGIAYLKDLSGWSRGSFHILQNSTGDGSSAGIADSVFTVLNDGNVGIGSTAPAQKLQVAGNGAFTGNVAIGTSSVSQRLTVNGTDPVVKIANDTLNSGTNSIQFNHAPGVSINKSGIFSEATGSWGLGQLHIAVNDDGDNSTNVSLTDTVATFTGAGNVGIGDTTPTYKLDVNGTGRFTGAVDLDGDLELNNTLTDINGAVGSAGQILSSTGSGVDWIDAPSGTNYWQRIAGNLSPVTLNDTLSATTSAAVAMTITQTGAFNALLVQDEASDASPFIIDQSGNVGVGTTTTTSYKLDVAGTFRASSTSNAVFGNGTSGGIQLGDATITKSSGNIFVFDSALSSGGVVLGNPLGGSPLGAGSVQLGTLSSTGNIGVDSAKDIVFYTSGAATGELLRLQGSAGNIGIGDATPTYKLDVNGTGRFTGAVDLDADLELNSTLTDVNGSVGTSGQILSSTATGVDWIDAPSGGAVAWNDLTAPTGNLSLAMDADTTSFSYNTLTSGTGWSLNSTATAFTGTLSDITLSGSNAANTGTLLALNNTGTSNANTSMLINHYATGTNNLAMRVNDVSGDTSPFIIDGTGNVGIGTTAASDTLDINGTLSFKSAGATSEFSLGYNGGVDLNYANGGIFRMTEVGVVGTNDVFFQGIPATTAGYTILEAYNSAGMIVGTGGSAGPVIFRPAGTEAVRILTNGNVGIGSTSPGALLDVDGNTILNGSLVVRKTGEPDVWLSYSDNNNYLSNTTYFRSNSGTSAIIAGASGDSYVNALGGNFGIGTTSPDFKLQVNGTVAPETTDQDLGDNTLRWDLFANTINDENNSTGTSGQILSSTATGVDWIDAPSGTNYWQRIAGNLSPLTLNDTISATTSAATAFTITQTGAFNAVLVEDQASDTSPFIINQDGNVGIGSTAASYKLDVTGDLRTTSTANFNAGVELGDATGDLISFNGRVDTSIVPNADGTVSLGSSTLRWDELFVKGATIDIGDDGDSGLFGYNVASDYFSFDPDNDATAEFVMTDTGNLGIGSVTPGQALDVVGNIRGAMFIDSLGAGSYFLDPAAGTTSLVVAGNIGIGSLGPTVALDVVGTGVFTGNVGIADAGPDYKLEISSATSADSSFALSDGDVAHGMTDITGAQGTDVYGLFRAISSTAGGLKLEAFSDTDATAFNMYGYVGNTTVTNTTPAIKLFGAIKTSATSADMAADDTVFQIANNDNTADFTMLGNGNVGIGSVTPGQKLSVSGNILATGNLVAGAYVRGENVAIGGNADGTFSGCSDFADMVCGSSNLWLGTNGGSIFFEDAVDANDKNITNIDNLQIDNNVGIGTTDVSSGRLNIQGAVTTGMLIEDSTTQGIRINSLASNAVGARISTTGSSGIGVQVDSVGTAGEFTSSAGAAIVGSGNWRGNVVQSVQNPADGASATVTISTPALIYDLQVEPTATINSATTITFDITGLPNTAGTFAFIHTHVDKAATPGTGVVTAAVRMSGGSNISSVAIATTTLTREKYLAYYIDGVWKIGAGTFTADTADLAEWLEYIGAPPVAGQIMALVDNTKGEISSSAYQSGVAGVVSTAPHTTMGPERPNSTPLALAGRVPVIVTTKNGQLKPGDYITSSALSGTGMKARFAGQVVGKAMESTASWVSCPAVSDINNIPWPEDDGTNPNKPCFTLPNGDVVGKIMMLIDNSWYEGDIKIDEAGQIQIAEQNGTYTVTEVGSGHAIERIVAYSQAIVGQIRAGMINTKDLVVEETASIANLSVESLQINGQSLADYIASVVGNGLQAPSNGQLAGDQSPVTTIELDDDEMFDIQDTDGTTVASIDSDGNASFSGEISSRVALLNELNADNASISGTTSLGSLLAENASVSGTLTAENIDAGSARIDMLESRVAELQAIKAQTAELVDATVSGTLYADNIANFEARVANAIDQPSLLAALLQQMPQNPVPPSTIIPPIEGAGYTATGAAELNLSLEDLNLDTDDVVLQPTAVFIDQYLKVNGIAYVADSLGVGNRLLVGDGMQISNGVIAYEPSTTESPLFTIQPSGKGSLELMAGLMTLNENGSVAVNGNLTVAGSLAVNETLLSNLLQPTDFNNPFQVQVAGVSTTSGELKQSRFEIINENKVPVATISAQGRAQFAGGIGIGSEDLGNGPVLQSSQTSGRATLSAYNPEVTIISDKITENSLVYITPVGSTNNRVLYVKSQEVDNPLTPEVDGKFVVGFDEALYTDIQFNWWIIN